MYWITWWDEQVELQSKMGIRQNVSLLIRCGGALRLEYSLKLLYIMRLCKTLQVLMIVQNGLVYGGNRLETCTFIGMLMGYMSPSV
jgi:hypothetical protein